MGKVTREIFVPRNGRITIKHHAAATTLGKKGILDIPAGQVQQPQRAVLKSIDPDVKIAAFVPGAELIVSKASGWELLLNNEPIKIMHHNDIWGTIELEEVDEADES